MHILVLPSSYPTKDAPIRGIFFKEQAVALKNSGHDVGVIYSETRRITGINLNTLKEYHFQKSFYREEGINVLRLHGWNVLMMRNSLGINLWIKQTIQLYNDYVKRFGKPDIIHVHCGLYGGMAAKLIKDKYSVPYIITEHSSNVLNNALDNFHKDMLVEAYNNANSLISVGKALKLQMAKYTDNNINVIPNIVNTEEFVVKNNKKNKFRFISVSFLIENKRVDLTIKAFKRVYDRNKNVELYIGGDGSCRQSLEELVKELNLEDSVKFLGKVDRKDMPDFLSNGDCFVLPSEYETFGVVYIEALACGLPIITTKCGGPEDFYNEDLGYMINVNDEDALYEAMNKVIDEKGKFSNEEISEYIKARFSNEVIVKEIEEIYSLVLNNNL